jgi:hypothetical protein
MITRTTQCLEYVQMRPDSFGVFSDSCYTIILSPDWLAHMVRTIHLTVISWWPVSVRLCNWTNV